ncbi:hypothetical protein AVEN_85494-1 [Araneus ventricosus]|uniref:Endonuclease/exonuclease/phosphatase domain-containing protein n=1 Tax=Araneus ventricosus TaxID=182803 RepID=A0A4Y2GSR7_ARAVE|nr:hypothetical protein AVEN_85494-1 [Araneus ventricosus]
MKLLKFIWSTVENGTLIINLDRYSAEETVELDAILTNIVDEKALIGAHKKAHSRAWGYRNEDQRRMKVDYLLDHQLFLLSETNSPPTFEHRRGKGLPDLSITKGAEVATTCNWKVLDEFSHRDHKYIKIDIMIN